LRKNRHDARFRLRGGQRRGECLQLLFQGGDSWAKRSRFLEPEGRHRDVVAVSQPPQLALDFGEPIVPISGVRRVVQLFPTVIPVISYVIPVQAGIHREADSDLRKHGSRPAPGSTMA